MRVGINGFVVFDYRPRLGFVLNFSFGAHFRHYFVKIIKSDPGYLLNITFIRTFVYLTCLYQQVLNNTV